MKCIFDENKTISTYFYIKLKTEYRNFRNVVRSTPKYLGYFQHQRQHGHYFSFSILKGENISKLLQRFTLTGELHCLLECIQVQQMNVFKKRSIFAQL